MWQPVSRLRLCSLLRRLRGGANRSLCLLSQLDSTNAYDLLYGGRAHLFGAHGPSLHQDRRGIGFPGDAAARRENAHCRCKEPWTKTVRESCEGNPFRLRNRTGSQRRKAWAVKWRIVPFRQASALGSFECSASHRRICLARSLLFRRNECYFFSPGTIASTRIGISNATSCGTLQIVSLHA